MFSLAALRRRTVSEKYIPNVDGLRFAAILAVVLLHIQVQDNPQIHLSGVSSSWIHSAATLAIAGMMHGARGVPLFFAISGFILALPFARYQHHGGKPVSLSFYFLRRLTRLEPPYILTLLLRLPLLLLIAHKPMADVMGHFAASLFYIHNLVYGIPSTINIPAWSLEIEIQFYCLVPLLALYFAARNILLRRVLLLLFMAAAGILQLLFIGPYGRANLSILFWIQFFLAGFLVADLFLVDWHRIPRHWLWDIAGIPLWLWMFLAHGRWFHTLMPFALIVVFIAAFKAPLQSWFFSRPLIATVGGMCYSIYLTHNMVLTGMHVLLVRVTNSPALTWICCLASVLLFGTIFYVLIERPCMDPQWPQRLWRRWFPSAAKTTRPAV